MKFDWKFILLMILPMLEASGHAYVNQDTNDTGKDDAIGEGLLYAVKLLKAIVLNNPLPKAPEALQ
jgi:hypothetical protein